MHLPSSSVSWYAGMKNNYIKTTLKVPPKLVKLRTKPGTLSLWLGSAPLANKSSTTWWWPPAQASDSTVWSLVVVLRFTSAPETTPCIAINASWTGLKKASPRLFLFHSYLLISCFWTEKKKKRSQKIRCLQRQKNASINSFPQSKS